MTPAPPQVVFRVEVSYDDVFKLAAVRLGSKIFAVEYSGEKESEVLALDAEKNVFIQGLLLSKYDFRYPLWSQSFESYEDAEDFWLNLNEGD